LKRSLIAPLEGAEGAMGVAVYVGSFLDRVPGAKKHGTMRQWLAAIKPQNTGPTELMAEISTALGSSADDLPKAIIRGIAFCLAEPPEPENVFQRPDRLPVSRARREAQAREQRLHPSCFGIVGLGAACVLVGRPGPCGCACSRQDLAEAKGCSGRGRLGPGSGRICGIGAVAHG